MQNLYSLFFSPDCESLRERLTKSPSKKIVKIVHGFILDKLRTWKLARPWSRMEEERPLDGRFMSRLTRLRLLSRRWQHHAFTTPRQGEREKGRGRGRGLHLSRCHIALTRDLNRSRGWSTISWLNRLINGSRGGSRPICITLGPLLPLLLLGTGPTTPY